MAKFLLNYPPFVSVKVLVGEVLSLGQVLATGVVPTKKNKINIASVLGIKPKDMLGYLKVKVGDKIGVNEIIAEKRAGFFKKRKVVNNIKEGFLEAIEPDTGSLTFGVMLSEYELVSPGIGKVLKISDSNIEIDFIGQEIHVLEALGNISFGESYLLTNNASEVDFSLINFEQKDKILVGGLWTKLSVVKANAVGASGIISVNLNFDLQTEKENLLRPLDPEGNSGFSIVKVSKETFEVIEKHHGKQIILDPVRKILCLLKS